MDRGDMKKIWEQAQRNGEALERCARHEFVDITPGLAIGKKHRCTNCGGELDSIGVRFYQQGLDHGQVMRCAMPDDVAVK